MPIELQVAQFFEGAVIKRIGVFPDCQKLKIFKAIKGGQTIVTRKRYNQSL